MAGIRAFGISDRLTAESVDGLQVIWSMNFGTTPRGGFMGKREPQTILKTDERAIRLELGCEGNSPPNQAVGTKAGFFLQGDKLEVAVKNDRWVLTHLPAGQRPALQPVQHYSIPSR
jgi:hypothetical protein